MLIGVTVPNSGVLAASDAAIEIAEYAERSGFDSVWVVDHVALPHVSSEPYPYARQRFAMPPAWPMQDPLIALAAIASRTTRVLLGTGVYLLPLRHPIVAAKMAASLDVLSKGRLLLGVGLGWIKEEYELLGIPWDARGPMFDEAIDLLRVLWREASPRFDGMFWQVRDIGFEPKPVNGAIPILIGGRNAPARRRAARRGDGWYLIDMKPEAIAEARIALAQDCADAGRSPDSVPLSMYASLTIRDQDVADSECEFPLMGSERQIAAKLAAYRRAGLGHVVLAARGLETVADHKATFDRIRERILPETGP